MRVVSCVPVANGIYELWLEAPAIARSACPGQFVMVKCETALLLRRPFSIHRVSPDKNMIALLFATVGEGTYWLSQIKSGMSLDVLGPLGHGFSINPNTQKLLMVAGGLGLAPLYFLAENAREQGKHIKFLIGAATAGDLYPVHRLPESGSCLITTDDGSYGQCGFVTEHLSICDDTVDQVFACGPLPMLVALSAANILGSKNMQVSMETRMACGLGICYGCTIDTRDGLKQVCKHGPVFNSEDIIWQKLKPV